MDSCSCPLTSMWALWCVHTHNSKYIFTKRFALFLCCKSWYKKQTPSFLPNLFHLCLAWLLRGCLLPSKSGSWRAPTRSPEPCRLSLGSHLAAAMLQRSISATLRPTALHPPRPSLHPPVLGSQGLAGFNMFTVQFLSLLSAWKPSAPATPASVLSLQPKCPLESPWAFVLPTSSAGSDPLPHQR